MFVLVPELANLGFVKETLIFKTWNILDLIVWTDRSLQVELSNVLLFWKQWREAPRTRSPSFPISSAEMSVIVSMISLNLILLYVWNVLLRYPHLSYYQHHRFEQNWFHQLGIMIVLPRWLISGLFSITNLYRLPHFIV